MNRFFHNIYSILGPIVRILMPTRVKGSELVPEGAAILCPNHAHALDPVVVSLALPNDSRISFMAKEELFRVSAISWFLRKLGGFPVKRGENDLTAMKTSLKALQDGGRLMVFPEGTRVEHPGEVEAKGGVIVIAARTGAPLVPIYCGGKRKFFHRNDIIFGEPYHPTFAGRRPTAEETQKAAAELLDRIYGLKEAKDGSY